QDDREVLQMIAPDSPPSSPSFGRSARERHPPGKRSGRRHARHKSSLRGELRAWVDVLDSLLTAVETTAWSARELADVAKEAWHDGENDLTSARDEASSWSGQVSRLTQT